MICIPTISRKLWDPPEKIKVTFCKEEEESNDKEVIAKVADIKDRSSIKDEV